MLPLKTTDGFYWAAANMDLTEWQQTWGQVTLVVGGNLTMDTLTLPFRVTKHKGIPCPLLVCVA